MNTFLYSSRLALTLTFTAFVSIGCSAPGGPSGDGSSGGNANDGPPGTGTGSAPAGDGDNFFPGDGDGFEFTDVPGENCGDGKIDEGEECDDNNDISTDGCNVACQLAPDFVCPVPGQPCESNVVCGDGKLSIIEACDDSNTTDGDGCNSTCTAVDAGWQCRVPGRACIPFCGDSVLTATENCDDGNAVSADGCSSTCLTEPGFSCDTPGSPCTGSQCGNGVVEVGEKCDAGAELNGLFFGDGTGCSKTCTQEPICRNAMGVTEACSTACGDGNIDTAAGEMCDDGNAVPGDGCSVDCMPEGGFTCVPAEKSDSSACPDGGGECLVLPITYRDFDASHPDFYFLGDGGVECVPNASGGKDTTGPTECWDSDSTDLCQGLAAPTLGPDGKPTLGAGTSCECRFTDWDSDLLNGTGAEYSDCQSGDANPTRIQTTVDLASSAASFLEWYHDGDSSSTVLSTLALEASGGGSFSFKSSDGRTIADDIEDGDDLESGFFPLDGQSANDVGGEQFCNLWPYWPNGIVDFPGCSGDQWNPDIEEMEDFDGVEHNFYFTSEVRYLFKYVGGEKLEFYGDDDVFVYINGQLTLDLGAPHEKLRGDVVLSDTSAVSTVEALDGDEVTTTPMTLVPGNIYEIAVFHADRHPRESNYQLTLQGFSTTQSECKPTCGDGIVTTGEECDDGPNNMDGLYGGCSTSCTYGPYCGDGVPNPEGGEECDLGTTANTAQYGNEGCTSTCLIPHWCGDGITDSAFGEECDDGPNIGKSSCKEGCILVIGVN